MRRGNFVSCGNVALDNLASDIEPCHFPRTFLVQVSVYGFQALVFTHSTSGPSLQFLEAERKAVFGRNMFLLRERQVVTNPSFKLKRMVSLMSPLDGSLVVSRTERQIVKSIYQ